MWLRSLEALAWTAFTYAISLLLCMFVTLSDVDRFWMHLQLKEMCVQDSFDYGTDALIY